MSDNRWEKMLDDLGDDYSAKIRYLAAALAENCRVADGTNCPLRYEVFGEDYPCAIGRKEGVDHSCEVTTPDMWYDVLSRLYDKKQSGWTSEIPTEDGEYIFTGEILFEYADNPTSFTDKQPAKVWANDNYVYFAGYSSSAFLHTAKGLWYRINYPEPPKE